ncbi:MAG: L-rhamnose mutarotase, partial [Anaerolineae bacterium]
MKRYGQVIRVKPEKLATYKRYHANVWPEVLEGLRQVGIHNYSIFHKDGCLFAYFEYDGEDLRADMARVGRDPKAQEWNRLMSEMQEPL